MSLDEIEGQYFPRTSAKMINQRQVETIRYNEFQGLLMATRGNRIVEHFARIYAIGNIQTFQEALCQIIIMACQTESELATQLRNQILMSMPNSQNAKI